ncbi:GSCOCG00006498001-RA-CDS [Cotesia congregata]|nr:GSCOCG00006498001-RA-CDS [Cotesia congregata]
MLVFTPLFHIQPVQFAIELTLGKSGSFLDSPVN